jgi:hypothetical protein
LNINYSSIEELTIDHLEAGKMKEKLSFGAHHVATPLSVKCEDETDTPKSGNLESSGTPKNSELEFRGQNTSH